MCMLCYLRCLDAELKHLLGELRLFKDLVH